MLFSKNGLHFAFGLLLSLSLSNVWSAESGGAGVFAGTAGLAVPSMISGSANQSVDNPLVMKSGTIATEGRAATAANSQDVGATRQNASENNAKKQDASESVVNKPGAADKQDQIAKADPSVFQSEFQNFVSQSVGHNLPMYGYTLFQNAPTTFAPADNVPVTPDYVVGPGDELIVHVWGQVEANQSIVVDRNGLINLPQIGSIGVAGVTYQKLSEHIGDAISRKFSNFEIDVSMGKLRSIQVLVVGQAARPGNYTISSLSSLVNAIFVSGGPSAKGSMRHIQLKRGNKVISDFDLYDLLLKGDKSKDVKLLPGDVIYIPPVGAMVAISGSVNTQAIFELRGSEDLSALLELAGGLTNVAAGQMVSVERIYEHKMRRIDEFQLDKNGLANAVRDGDVVTVFSISPRFDNAVKLQGNVAAPMRYIWKEGMRVSDLLKDKNSVIAGAYWASQISGAINERSNKKQVNWDYAVVQRLDSEAISTRLFAFNLGKAIKGDPVENMLLLPGDIVNIYSNEAALPEAENSVALKGGAISSGSRRFVWHEGMRIADLIPGEKWLAGYVARPAGEDLTAGLNWNYAKVVRLLPDGISRTMLTFNLARAISGSEDHNLRLSAGDEVSIFTNKEFKVSGEKSVKFITLEGEVAIPGLYPVEQGETLRQVVARVGGVTSRAYLRGAVFTRDSVRELQQKNLNEAVDRMAAELKIVESEAEATEQALAAPVAGKSAMSGAPQSVSAKMASQYATLESMRKIKAEGRIVLELPAEGAQLHDLPDIALEDGDRFSVPSMPATVSVAGAVYNPSTFVFRSGRVVDDYLQKAGGSSRSADDDNIYVVLADGTVKSSRSSSIFGGGLHGYELKPGDLVFVPQKIVAPSVSLVRTFMDWTQVMYQLALTVAGGKAARMW